MTPSHVSSSAKIAVNKIASRLSAPPMQIEFDPRFPTLFTCKTSAPIRTPTVPLTKAAATRSVKPTTTP